ncbi:MAG: hypothetical protein PHC80_02245 [Eubacteriales bacterium]|nr:hypothetical protein [Eubacteriales bacterium]
MEQKKRESLEEILSEGREFDEEQAKARAEKTIRMFRTFLLCVVSFAVFMVIMGLIFK